MMIAILATSQNWEKKQKNKPKKINEVSSLRSWHFTCTIRKLFSPFIQKRDYMSESVRADSSGCPERTLRPQNSHCQSRRNVLSHVTECGGMCGMVRWFAAFFFFSFLLCFCPSFAAGGAQRAPFRSHPRVFCGC
jgi:hypothetical protein